MQIMCMYNVHILIKCNEKQYESKNSEKFSGCHSRFKKKILPITWNECRYILLELLCYKTLIFMVYFKQVLWTGKFHLKGIFPHFWKIWCVTEPSSTIPTVQCQFICQSSPQSLAICDISFPVSLSTSQKSRPTCIFRIDVLNAGRYFSFRTVSVKI